MLEMNPKDGCFRFVVVTSVIVFVISALTLRNQGNAPVVALAMAAGIVIFVFSLFAAMFFCLVAWMRMQELLCEKVLLPLLGLTIDAFEKLQKRCKKLRK